MPEGTLEVLLEGAKGLENTDFLSNMDPYAILTIRTQEKKSSVASGQVSLIIPQARQGCNPEWNETFLFTISGGSVSELKIKLLDSDGGITKDDFVGETTIPLESVLTEGCVPPKSYNVLKDDAYCGEIRVGLTFTPQRSRGFDLEESFGGWKQSARD